MAYSEAYFSTRQSWRDWRIEAQQLIQLARIYPAARVLEVGCGGGGLLHLLQDRARTAVGIDSSRSALFFAQKGSCENVRPAGTSRIHVNLVHASANSPLPFCSDTFDAVLAQHLVEHLADLDAALGEWKRVLVPGGRIAVATPNRFYPDPAHFAAEDHIRIFGPHELADSIRRMGFEIESRSTIFPFLSRYRPLRAVGVMAYRLFQHVPYFGEHGRTILLSARK